MHKGHALGVAPVELVYRLFAWKGRRIAKYFEMGRSVALFLPRFLKMFLRPLVGPLKAKSPIATAACLTSHGPVPANCRAK